MIAGKRWRDAERIHCASQLYKAATDGSQWGPHQQHRALKRLWTLLSKVTIVPPPIEGEKRAVRVEKQDGGQAIASVECLVGRSSSK